MTPKPIAGTQAAKNETVQPSAPATTTPPVSTQPVTTDEKIASALDKIEAMEQRLADRELALVEREKELEKKIEANRFLKPMSPEVRAHVEEIHASKAEIMKKHLEKQPKVRMFIPLQGQEKAGTILPVVMNGYRINVPKGMYVDLPQQVADLLTNSFNQTEQAGAAFRLDKAGKEKQDAMTGGLTQG